MTTPNQNNPGWNPYYGDYAWEVGGGVWNYGQSLTEDDIAMIIHGPRAEPGNVNALFQDKLLQQPLEVLRMFQPFIPDSTVEDDFPDVPLSVSTIMKWLPGNPLLQTVENTTQWLEETFDPLVDKVQSIIDAIIQGFHAWWEQNGFTEQDVSEFSNNVAQAIGTIGTLGIRLSKLEGAQAKVFEDFTTYPNDSTTLGSKWFQFYTGSGNSTLGVVNDYALMQVGLLTNNRYGYAIHKTSTESDLHRVAAPMSTPQSGLFEKSANLLIARAEPKTGTDFVFAWLEGEKAEIGYVKAGKRTVLGSAPNFKFKNGAVYSLDCTEQRTFKLFENDTEILAVVDSTGGSTASVNNRYVGFGVYGPNSSLRPGAYGSLAAFVKQGV